MNVPILVIKNYFKRLAKELMSYADKTLSLMIKNGSLIEIEVTNHE
ncbi:type II toxin-antitoxin system RelE/ParE family toxin [Beggiatoa alba]|nr:hypothetical protein [Beggiatoa alba]